METKIFKIIILLVIPVSVFCSNPKEKNMYLERELDCFFGDYYRVPYSTDEFLVWEESRIDSLSLSFIVYNYIKKKDVHFNNNDNYEMDVFKKKRILGHYKNDVCEVVNNLDNPLILKHYEVRFYNTQGEILEMEDSLITDLYNKIGSAIERKNQYYHNGHIIIKYIKGQGISDLCKENITIDNNFVKIKEILDVFSEENNVNTIVIPIHFVW